MNFFTQPAHSAPAARMPEGAREAASVDDDDLAIGCECALPQLQIETWGSEAVAQQPAHLS